MDGIPRRCDTVEMTMFVRHTVQAENLPEKKRKPRTHTKVRRGFAASIDAPSARLSLGQVASPQSLPPFHRATPIVNQFDTLNKSARSGASPAHMQPIWAGCRHFVDPVPRSSPAAGRAPRRSPWRHQWRGGNAGGRRTTPPASCGGAPTRNPSPWWRGRR